MLLAYISMKLRLIKLILYLGSYIHRNFKHNYVGNLANTFIYNFSKIATAWMALRFKSLKLGINAGIVNCMALGYRPES